jgi:hypothetical protein
MRAKRLGGQAAIELAVVLPALLLLGLGLIELVHWRVVHHLSLLALVDTVRHASTAGLDPAGIDRALALGLQRLELHDPLNPQASLAAFMQQQQRTSQQLGLPERWWTLESPSSHDFANHHDAVLANALGISARVIDPAWLAQRETPLQAARPGSRTKALQLTLSLRYPLQAITPLGRSLLGSHHLIIHRVSAPMQALAIEPAGLSLQASARPVSRPWLQAPNITLAADNPSHIDTTPSRWQPSAASLPTTPSAVRGWLQSYGRAGGGGGTDEEGCGITLCCEPPPS